MASINKVFLIGNLGADPELRQAGSSPVCNFRIATTEVWNSKQSGERQERTEWHRIVVWGKSAEHWMMLIIRLQAMQTSTQAQEGQQLIYLRQKLNH